MKKGRNKKNFEVYSAEEFIAAITQHIPDKFSRLVRYFGFCRKRYSCDCNFVVLFNAAVHPA
ncbi:MAG: hypothetical protein HN580_09040 [Deltaproteobacteria bacterium]|nr:hypothetical protein [Deltaproteobacteria bacterium]MBT4268449.1 hypothetical protein [Deltaproteobacteria bacterium]MBT4638566.1 hypothetical protein [Deltaproteobacteria bacterium]MBT6613195.1 hypothetical protein [Deltaproteobacteria bacterium]MBT7889154.1 hypothetical protein [Deltaproteobacteria bacterium]